MQRYNWLSAWQVYEQIPEMKRQSILPDEGFKARALVLTTAGHVFPVECAPKPAQIPTRHHWRKRQLYEHQSGHRLIVFCACGRAISMGRMNQHVPKCPIVNMALKYPTLPYDYQIGKVTGEYKHVDIGDGFHEYERNTYL